MRGKIFFFCTLGLSALLAGWAWNLYAQIERAPAAYLKIAPRDPRAFLLGDYMTLFYDFEAEPVASDEDVLYLGENRVLSRQSGGEAVPVRTRGKEYLVPRQYFFQEGTGKKFENARYAAVKLLPGGKMALWGLADENFNLIERSSK